MILKKHLWLLLLVFPLSFFNCRTETAPSTQEEVSAVPDLIRARLRGEPDGLMPWNTSRGSSLQIARIVFPMLVDLDRTTYKLTPVLCKAIPKEIPITEGPLAGGYKLTFEIRDEAVWDNGTPVTGKDYEFTIKSILNPKGKGLFKYYSTVYSLIKKIEIDANNPKIFTVYCDKPNFKLAETVGGWILPAYHYDPTGLLTNIKFEDLVDTEKAVNLDMESLTLFGEQIVSPKYSLEPENIVSCGAYKVTEWTPSEQIVLTKKENWWGEKLGEKVPLLTAYPKALSFKFVTDNNAAIALLKNDELDVLGTIDGNSFSELQTNEMISAKYEFATPATSNVNFMGMNNSNPKLADVKVRKAISYLIDREKMASAVYNGYANPIYSVVPVKNEFYESYDTKYSVEKASALLEEAGWKDADGNGIREKRIDGKVVPLSLDILSSTKSTIGANIIRVLTESFKKAGIEITNTKKEVRAVFKSRAAGDFEMLVMGMIAPPGYYDPSQYWKTDSPMNFFKAGNAELDALIDEITTNVDPTKFRALYSKFQQMMDETQPVAFLLNSSERLIIKKGYKEKLITEMSPNYYLPAFR